MQLQIETQLQQQMEILVISFPYSVFCFSTIKFIHFDSSVLVWLVTGDVIILEFYCFSRMAFFFILFRFI